MELIAGSNDEISFRILKLMNRLHKERIGYEFVGIERRFKASLISFLIVEDNEDIGFMYLTDEDKPGMFFLDISILRNYRFKGIGYEAIKELLNRYKNCGVKNFVLAEVETDNIACLKVMKKLGSIQVSEKHFLLQPERIMEFRNFIVNESIDLMAVAPDIIDVIELLHIKNGDNEKQKVKKILPEKNDK